LDKGLFVLNVNAPSKKDGKIQRKSGKVQKFFLDKGGLSIEFVYSEKAGSFEMGPRGGRYAASKRQL
jgi:hypothetical protein